MAAISKIVMNIKPGRIDDAYKFIDSKSHLVGEIEALIGMAVAKIGENELTGIGVYESQDAAEAAAPVSQEVFSEMASLITSMPERGVFSGMWVS